jgi:hypothetical protein
MRSVRQRASGRGARARRRWLRLTAAVLAPVSIVEQARLLGWGNLYGHATGGSNSPVLSPVQVSGLGDGGLLPQPGGDPRRGRMGVGP